MKTKHVQCCIHFLLVIFKRVIFFPPQLCEFQLLESLSGAAMKTGIFFLRQSIEWAMLVYIPLYIPLMGHGELETVMIRSVD